MTFFSLLCALLLEQLYPLPASHPAWRAQQRLADWTFNNLDAGRPMHGWIAWAAAAILPVALSFAIYRLLAWAGWPLALAWNALLLYATLSFRQFGDYISAIREALERGDELRARQLFAQWKGNAASAALPRHAFTQQVLEYAVLNVHRHMFGLATTFVLFAMLGMGPAGAVLYWCADFVRAYWRQQRQHTGIESAGFALQVAQTAWHWINWLPTRTTAACFAIVGNFELAIDNWRQLASTTADASRHRNEALLLAVAAGAIDIPGNFSTPAATIAKTTTRAAGTNMTTNTHIGTPPTATAAEHTTQDPTLAEDAGMAYGVALYTQQPSGMLRLHMLARLVWRSVLLWGLLIALITVTHWVS